MTLLMVMLMHRSGCSLCCIRPRRLSCQESSRTSCRGRPRASFAGSWRADRALRFSGPPLRLRPSPRREQTKGSPAGPLRREFQIPTAATGKRTPFPPPPPTRPRRAGGGSWRRRPPPPPSRPPAPQTRLARNFGFRLARLRSNGNNNWAGCSETAHVNVPRCLGAARAGGSVLALPSRVYAPHLCPRSRSHAMMSSRQLVVRYKQEPTPQPPAAEERIRKPPSHCPRPRPRPKPNTAGPRPSAYPKTKHRVLVREAFSTVMRTHDKKPSGFSRPPKKQISENSGRRIQN